MYNLRIRDIREDHDNSQSEIAKILGTNQKVYSRYETGINEIPVRHICKLAEHYNVSTDYLLGKTKDPTPPNERAKQQEEKAPAKFDLAEALRGLFLERTGREPTQQDLQILKKFAETFIDGMIK